MGRAGNSVLIQSAGEGVLISRLGSGTIRLMMIPSLELFAGAGGLGMGAARAGFQNLLAVEFDQHACATLSANARAGHPLVKHWQISDSDVREVDYSILGEANPVVLVLGGPPCQPFSVGGKARGALDGRDMFPEAVRSVRETRPLGFVFENVFGLLRPAFATYLEYVLLQLGNPSIKPSPGEDSGNHLRRLEEQVSSGHPPEYRVFFQELNAVDYGVPQKRRRVFFVGFRADLEVCWSFPAPTHSQEELVRAKWIDESYWEEHGIPENERPTPTKKEVSILRRIQGTLTGQSNKLRWRTVRDAIADLPDPREGGDKSIPGHQYRPGARAYPGHDGSPLDEPSKALKAGVHGVPGGENMLRYCDGTVRYFTVREAARIQTFPDNFTFPGSWSETMRQLGNAVPVQLAEVVTGSVKKALLPFIP